MTKVEIFGGFKEVKLWIQSFFVLQATFLPVGRLPTNPTKVAEKVYLGVLQHPNKTLC